MTTAEECKELSQDIVAYKVMKFLELMKSDVILAMAEGKSQCGTNDEAENFLEIKSARGGYTGIGMAQSFIVLDDDFIRKVKSAGFHFKVASSWDHNDYANGWKEIESGQELERTNGRVYVNLAWD